MSETLLMEEMSWEEIQNAVQAGKTTVILAAGAVEQHGPHLPTGTDTYLGYALAEGVARKLGDTLVAPVLRPGLSEHHIDFPGSFTFSFQSFLQVLEEYCVSLSRHGFKDIVLISSHGGNTDAMLAYMPTIAKKLKDRCRLHMAMGDLGEYFGNERVKKVYQDYEVRRGEAGAHGGFDETSMMLAVHPELVNMERAEDGRSDEEFYAPEQLKRSQLESFVYGVRSQSPNGILGDPRKADGEAGRELLQARVELTAERIRRLVEG